jgi:hypothetical protein
MQNKKRILSVTIKRMFDDSPDTSWLGEYSNKAETEYAIDRGHSLDCASVSVPFFHTEDSEWMHYNDTAVNILERIITHLNSWRMDEGNKPESTDWEDLDESIDVCVALQDDIVECGCSFSGHWNNREYRYFNGPVENYKGLPDADIRKYVRQDYERMESLNAGHFCFIGIRAECEIRVPYMTEGKGGRTYFKTETISSPGLFGVESDSDKAYFADIEKEELSSLREELRSLGFSSRAISAAFKNVERKED